MSMNDTISNFITVIRNAYLVKHASCKVIHSKKLESIAKVLKKEGYIADYSVLETDSDNPAAKKILNVNLSYVDGQAAIVNIKRVSRPGLRKYSPASELKKVIGGMGTQVVSTSRGVITDREARSLNVGGEVWIEII